jgi:probable HAF family extracellular repeat protein
MRCGRVWVSVRVKGVPMRRSVVSVVAGVVVVAVVAGAVSASLACGASESKPWVIRDLGTLGGRESFPFEINGRGQIVGVSDTSASTHAFLWEAGKMVDLGAFGGTSSSARGINERGEIVGLRIPDPAVAGMKDGYPYKAFPVLWRNGQVTALPELTVSGCDGNVDWDFLLGIDDRSRVVGTINITTENSGCRRAAVWLGGRWEILRGLSRAVAFNQRGQIVGSDVEGSGSVLSEARKATALGTLGGERTEAVAISERGQIVGSSETTSGAFHAFLWQAGKLTDLGTLGGNQSRAAAINERGQIVGRADTNAKDGNGDPVSHAFLWENGRMRDLGTLGGPGSSAEGINARGQIVGTAITADGRSHAFAWANGSITDLGTLPGHSTSAATAINDNGQIIGSSTTRAVLWTPRG